MKFFNGYNYLNFFLIIAKLKIVKNFENFYIEYKKH